MNLCVARQPPAPPADASPQAGPRVPAGSPDCSAPSPSCGESRDQRPLLGLEQDRDLPTLIRRLDRDKEVRAWRSRPLPIQISAAAAVIWATRPVSNFKVPAASSII
jgi:hypothetical protein